MKKIVTPALMTIVALTFISCVPQLRYLGDIGGRPGTSVDVSYDAFDIKNEYRVLGIITNVPSGGLHTMDDIKNAMVEHARKVGGDAILFTGLYANNASSTTIEGKVLKYTLPSDRNMDQIR